MTVNVDSHPRRLRVRLSRKEISHIFYRSLLHSLIYIETKGKVVLSTVWQSLSQSWVRKENWKLYFDDNFANVSVSLGIEFNICFLLRFHVVAGSKIIMDCTCNTRIVFRLQTITRLGFNKIDILKFIDKRCEENLRHSGIIYLNNY